MRAASRLLRIGALIALFLFLISEPPFRQIMLVMTLVLGAAAVVTFIGAHSERVYWSKGVEDIQQHHCPHCRYDLKGTREDRCPECGTAVGDWWRKASVALTRDVAPGLQGLGSPRMFHALIAAAEEHGAASLWLLGPLADEPKALASPLLAVQFEPGRGGEEDVRAIREVAEAGMRWPLVRMEEAHRKLVQGRGVRLTLLWARMAGVV